MNRCMRHHHNDTTGTDHRCQLADGHTGPHADPELRTSTRSPRGVHSMQWDDDGTEVPHTEHVHTAPRLVDTDGVGITYQPPSVPAEPPAAVLPPIDMPRNPYLDVDPPAYPDVSDYVRRAAEGAAIYVQPPDERLRDERHRVLGKLVADVAERRDHTTQIDGVLIAPCDSRGYLVPIVTDDPTTQQPPAELRERVLADYDNGRTDRAVGQIQAATRRLESHGLNPGEVMTLVNAAQTILDAHARAVTEVDQQRIRAEAAEADLADVVTEIDNLHARVSTR